MLPPGESAIELTAFLPLKTLIHSGVRTSTAAVAESSPALAVTVAVPTVSGSVSVLPSSTPASAANATSALMGRPFVSITDAVSATRAPGRARLAEGAR